MLDYKKIKSEFTKKLAEFDEAKLLSWVKFDECRLKHPVINNDTVTLFDKWFEQFKNK